MTAQPLPRIARTPGNVSKPHTLLRRLIDRVEEV
jgi:hypothetical protein